MANGVYLGINGVARKVDGLYLGVNGVARKVLKGYVGVNGVAREFYSQRTGIPARFVTVGDGGLAYYSYDGVTWTAMTGINSSYDMRGVCYNEDNDIYVALGEVQTSSTYSTAYLYQSNDGETWTLISHNLPTTTNFYTDICYGNGKYVIVGTAGRIYYSTNLTTWTQALTATTSMKFNQIVYGNGYFVAAPNNESANIYSGFYYSSDGATWNSRNIAFEPWISGYTANMYPRTVAYNSTSNYFMLCGQPGFSFSLDNYNIMWYDATNLSSGSFVYRSTVSDSTSAYGGTYHCACDPVLNMAYAIQDYRQASTYLNCHQMLYVRCVSPWNSNTDLLDDSRSSTYGTGYTAVAYGNGKIVSVGRHQIAGASVSTVIESSTTSPEISAFGTIYSGSSSANYCPRAICYGGV